MKTRDAQETREKILRAAEQKFSEKGFDGASISEIAKAVGVNSALLYYYFENKQAIMDELFDSFIKEANSYLIEIALKKYPYGSPEMEEQLERYNSYLISQDKTLRLLLTESLKCDGRRPPLFNLIDSDSNGIDEESMMNDMNSIGFNFDADANQRKVTEFFTGIMPLVIFSVFRQDWCRAFNLEDNQLKQYFQYANDITHHQHHSIEKKKE